MRLDRERLTLAVPASAWDDLFRHEARLQAVAEATFQGVERGFEVELRRYADGDENVAGETLHDRRTRLASERLSARKAAAVQDPGVLTAMSVLGVQIHRVLPR